MFGGVNPLSDKLASLVIMVPKPEPFITQIMDDTKWTWKNLQIVGKIKFSRGSLKRTLYFFGYNYNKNMAFLVVNIAKSVLSLVLKRDWIYRWIDKWTSAEKKQPWFKKK
jgi:hypothetical protein